jgi:hypothetical protein
MRLVAIYHLRVKCMSRSHGQSAQAAAAYRSAARIRDERELLRSGLPRGRTPA